MSELVFTARNFATASENKIHDDAVAKQFGFRGGLVPGVTLYGYLAEAVLAARGGTVLVDGCLRVRFAKPVYEGEPVTATMHDDGELVLANSRRTVCDGSGRNDRARV
jgi:acyl dehydratase